MKKILLTAVAVIGLAGASFAAVPIQLSLWDKMAVPPGDAVYGLEIGIGNNLSEIKGVQWNLVWSQAGGGLGLQAGLLTKVSGKFTGLQWGFIHLNEGSISGAEFGLANFDKGSVTGASFGFINYAKELTGLQFGFVNYAENGGSFALQLGLVNYLGNSSIYKWFPFVNLKF
jgi:opacity protein-like surface antigen